MPIDAMIGDVMDAKITASGYRSRCRSRGSTYRAAWTPQPLMLGASGSHNDVSLPHTVLRYHGEYPDRTAKGTTGRRLPARSRG